VDFPRSYVTSVAGLNIASGAGFAGGPVDRDVKTVYIHGGSNFNNTVTVREGVAGVTGAGANSVAVLERRGNANVVVTLFFNNAPGVADRTQILFVSSRIGDGGSTTAEPRSWFNAWMNGNPIDGGILVDERPYPTGSNELNRPANRFYLIKSVEEGLHVLDEHEMAAFSDSQPGFMRASGAASVVNDATVTGGVVDNADGRPAPTGGYIVMTESTIIIDTRPQPAGAAGIANQTDSPITPTRSGISAAVAEYAFIEFGVLYDARPDGGNRASIIYIFNNGAKIN
jgi:hypothetical protein